MNNQIIFTAIVESRDDPLKLGRMQVRVFGVHSESLDDIPTESLPWAIPLMPATSASVSGIGQSSQYIEGSTVMVMFIDGDSKQQPIILGSYHGIPLDKSPFGTNGKLTIESIENSKLGSEVNPTEKVKSSVLSTAENTVLDTSGTPVLDSDGKPIKTGSEPLTTTSDALDLSKMTAKYGSNVNNVYKALVDAGIRDKFAQTAILCNVAKECEFSPRRENMNYSSVSRLRSVFPSKFSKLSDLEAAAYVNNEKDLANFVYAFSDGNGASSTGDGYNFRGGGFIQLTKKNNYIAIGSGIGVDLVSKPDSINDSIIGSKAVAQYFINRFGGANRLKFDSLETALYTVTSKVNPGGLNADMPKVREIAKLCVIPTNPDKNTADKEESESLSPNAPENDLIQDATKDEIDSGIVGGETPVSTITGGTFSIKTNSSSNLGFKDPNKKYPLSSMLKEQDTNRLTRRNTKNTPVQTKLRNRRTGIRSIGSNFSEPAPAYNGKYPYNHVYFSESGHLQEYDDTPGNERFHNYHKSGTYQEIDKFGNQTNKIIGDNFTVVERNGYVYIDGTARVTVNSDVKLVVAGNLQVEVDGDLVYDVGGNVTWKVGGDTNMGVQGRHSVSCGDMASIDAPNIHFNSGVSAFVQPSGRSPTVNDNSIQVPDNFLGAETLTFDDADPADVDTYYKNAIANGTVTQKELDEGDEKAKSDAEVDNANPTKDITDISSNCQVFQNMSNIPESLQLSSKYTLSMLSTKTLVSSYKVVPQVGLREDQIVCNLKMLAENCLDKIKNKYPNMVVTSAFRAVGSNTKSEHPYGRAADMQFTGASKNDYFSIAQWIRDNVSFNQLLLEYKTTGTGNPWIHISYSSDGNKQEVMTFMNDKPVTQGLKNLA